MIILHAKDLQSKFKFGRDKSYELIQKIKLKHGLTYKEAVITENLLEQYFNE